MINGMVGFLVFGESVKMLCNRNLSGLEGGRGRTLSCRNRSPTTLA
jgi:hypothetical protein